MAEFQKTEEKELYIIFLRSVLSKSYGQPGGQDCYRKAHANALPKR